MFDFSRQPLARQFLLASLVILVGGMFVIGVWLSDQIKQVVINRTAAVTSLYVESLLTHHLTRLEEDKPLDEETLGEIEQLFLTSAFGEQIVSFKLWSPDGEILYSPSTALRGQQFTSPELEQAVSTGEVVSLISGLDEAENTYERQNWDRLIETYAPLKMNGGENIVAVAEFYQRPDALEAEIRAAQVRSWLVVGLATAIMFAALNGMVGRASHTILRQQAELEEYIHQLEDLLTQNEHLHQRVRRAAARTTTLNERFLRRVSSDLHDGPAQDVSLALLRMEAVAEDYDSNNGNGSRSGDFDTISTALKSALSEIRAISAGLRLPQLHDLSMKETLQRAVRDYRRKTGIEVPLKLESLPTKIPLSVRITAYRIVQEALSNGYQHADGQGQGVKAYAGEDHLCVEIRDSGPGFDPTSVKRDGHLGLSGMRERAELLGGTFEIDNTGEGTVIAVRLPLNLPKETPKQHV